MTTALSFYLLGFLIAIVCVDVCRCKKMKTQPSFVPGKNNITAREGGIATLPCTVHNLGTRDVSWRRSGSEHFLTIGTTTWVQDGNVHVEHKEWPGDLSDWNLVFEDVQLRDAGPYECQVIHTERITWEVYLHVLDKPVPRAGKSRLYIPGHHNHDSPHGDVPGISLEGKDFVELGDHIRLVCTSTEGSRVPEDVDWFKDGNKINSEDFPHIVLIKHRVLENKSLISELIIDRARKTDSGTYICRSSLEQIASLEVTVLVAGSTNTKRGSGSSQTAGPHSKAENCAVTLTFLSGNSCAGLVALSYVLTFNYVTT